MELTERQERILKTIVEQYIATAHPVGSEAVLSASGLKISSATVRNDMGVLEEGGYIKQPHTSGGRMPTNAGYDYYVDHLMEPSQVSRAEAHHIESEFQRAHQDMQEWLKLAAHILARRIRNVGLVSAPMHSEVRLRHVELVSIQTGVVLVLVVLHDGTVLQEMVPVEAWTQEELSALADRLGHELSGLGSAQIEAHAASHPQREQPLVRMVASLLRRGEERETEIYHAGLAALITQPEFLELRHGESMSAMNDRIRQVVDFLDRGARAGHLMTTLGEGEVRVVVGGGSVLREMRDYSFVLGRYGRHNETGFLGIVGPTRMEYTRAVAVVRYMTSLMTDLTDNH